MFVFGHMGIGSVMVRPWANPLRKLSFLTILLGTLLPDLLDKSLYYGLAFWTGKKGIELGLICGTRTFGHTLLFLGVLAALAAVFKNRWLASLSVGVATHLVLDFVPDAIFARQTLSTQPWLWPFTGMGFPVYPYAGLEDHIGKLKGVYFIYTETIGFIALVFVFKKMRTRKVIAEICPARLETASSTESG